LIDIAFLASAKILSAFTRIENKLEHNSGTEEFIRRFNDNYIHGHERKNNTKRKNYL